MTSNILSHHPNIYVFLLFSPLRRPARKVRWHPEAVRSSGTRSAPELRSLPGTTAGRFRPIVGPGYWKIAKEQYDQRTKAIIILENNGSLRKPFSYTSMRWRTQILSCARLDRRSRMQSRKFSSRRWLSSKQNL